MNRIKNVEEFMSGKAVAVAVKTVSFLLKDFLDATLNILETQLSFKL